VKIVRLGRVGDVSRLTLGGGGLGQVWGRTDRTEAIETVQLAVEYGITLYDVAPLYGRGEAETVIGEAFGGRPPSSLKFTTKCALGTPPANEVASTIRRRLERSLELMKLPRVDLLFLHSSIIPDDYRFGRNSDTQHRFATTWTTYRDHVIPAFERLRDEGLIGDWGITGIGLPATIIDALDADPKPAAVQCVANCLDSAGGMRFFDEPARPRDIIGAAVRNGVGVLGIRAVQAGALTDAFDRDVPPDHPEALDYARAAPLRALAEKLATGTAVLAHRYALGMKGVDSVILGVKNRSELADCVSMEVAGPLPPDLVREIDRLLAG
jgi:aryl-alcohol dehydrogenase-like predicted oxidoreductase